VATYNVFEKYRIMVENASLSDRVAVFSRGAKKMSTDATKG
jgi:hypothetical protein